MPTPPSLGMGATDPEFQSRGNPATSRGRSWGVDGSDPRGNRPRGGRLRGLWGRASGSDKVPMSPGLLSQMPSTGFKLAIALTSPSTHRFHGTTQAMPVAALTFPCNRTEALDLAVCSTIGGY